MCMFCKSLFVLLYFVWWPLCCLFFDIRILITPLVSSNSSYQDEKKHNTICVGQHYAQTSTDNVNKTCALLQMEIKTNRTSFLCGNCNGLHNTEFRTTNSNVNERLTTSWSRKINNHENNTKMQNFRMHVIWCGFFGYSCPYPFVLNSQLPRDLYSQSLYIYNNIT